MSGDNNFLQFDVNKLLMLSDEDYNASLTRLNGVSAGQASAALHNKLFFQVTTFIAAFAKAMSDAGLNATDVDLNILSVSINNFINNSNIARFYPIGSIYCNASNAANPHDIFGFGTWVTFGSGKMLLGASETHIAGQTGGEETHTLIADEMPTHNHTGATFKYLLKPPYAGSLTGNDNTGSGNEQAVSPGDGGLMVDAGGGQAHNNMPPFVVVYMWVRTA